jgi:hypothetical protein
MGKMGRRLRWKLKRRKIKSKEFSFMRLFGTFISPNRKTIKQQTELMAGNYAGHFIYTCKDCLIFLLENDI